MGTYEDPEVVDVETPSSLDSSHAIAALNRSEIDMQVTTAKKYPRDVVAVQKKMQSLATMDEETASSCFYTLPRGGKPIQGESVRLAEIAIATYQNCRAGTRIVSIEADGDNPAVTVQAAFHDVENNVMITIEKRRRITKKKSKPKPDEDDIQLAVAACTSIALRDATFRVIPKSFVRPVYLACKKIAVGDASSLAKNRQVCVDKLVKMGAMLPDILAVVDAKRVEDIDLEKLELLIGLGSAIKNGELSIENAFPDSHAAGSKVGTSDVDAKFGKGKADDAASQAGANSDARKVPTLDDVKKEFDEARSKTSAKVIYNKYCGPDSTFGDDDRALIEASYQAACKRIDEAAARKKPGEQKELGDA